MEWISVQDKLPERNGNRYSQVPCLVNKKYYRVRDGKEVYYYRIQILVFNYEHWCWDQEDGDDYDCEIDNVTHWQPLPEPPKQ